MKTVLITGANRGIGLGLTQYYLASGARVVAACRTQESEEAFNQWTEPYGDQFIPITMDVSKESSIADTAKEFRDKNITFDLIINNAGVCVLENFGDWTGAGFENTLKVNATGPALVSQALVPFMKSGSKLINMTSGMGSLELNLNPREGLDAYAMSKAALNILTRRLADRLEEDGIIVVALSPGWVQTDMGGDTAPMSVEEACLKIVDTIEHLSLAQTGQFVGEDGEPIPW